jgi:nucleoside-diphosphate-sugar epimerase
MAKYLVTGAAGFIGSNIVETILGNGDEVVAFDSFATGKRENLAFADAAAGFRLVEGDVRDADAIGAACRNVDYVLHLAALGSVPRSVEQPVLYNDVNVTGTVNVLVAARDAGVKRVVYSASSSAYGDTPTLPKREDMCPCPISPYAVAKLAGEHYMAAFWKCYGLQTVSLRYFNVFGRRQDPFSQYAAVIPAFAKALLSDKAPTIYGDGEQSRDFTYVGNVVHANLTACTAPEDACGGVYNIACGERVTVNQLFRTLAELLGRPDMEPDYEAERAGDVKHSLADIAAAREKIGYDPATDFASGLREAASWYAENLAP